MVDLAKRQKLKKRGSTHGGDVTDFANDTNRSPEPEPNPARRYLGHAAPFDESPTVAILDRFREARGRNGWLPGPERRAQRTPEFPRGDDGGFAERFLWSRRNGSRHMGDT